MLPGPTHAAVTALAAIEQYRRRLAGITEAYSVADAVTALVNFRDPIYPNRAWQAAYETKLKQFIGRVRAAA